MVSSGEYERTRQRQRWAYGYTSRVSTPPPAYGTDEWLALPEGAEKWAAVVIAAEALKHEEDHYLENLDVEMRHIWHVNKALEDQDFAARRDAHQREYGSKTYNLHPANRRARGGEVA